MKRVAWIGALVALAAGCSSDSSVADPYEVSEITGYIVAHTSVSFGLPNGGRETVPAVDLATTPTSAKPLYRAHYDPAAIRSQSGATLAQSDLVIGRRVAVTTRAPFLLSDPLGVSGESITVFD